MKAMIRIFAVIFALSLFASMVTAAEPGKINKSIYGFYLGEAKASLLERAAKEGIAYDKKGKMSDQLFPESYRFDGALDKSDQVKFAIVSFYKDRVGQVNVHFNDSSEKQFKLAAQGLDESWNSFSGFKAQTFGPIYIVTLPDVLITLVEAKANTETHISYVHRKMLGAYNVERKSASRKS